MKAIDRLYEYLDYKNIKPTNFEKDLELSNGYLSIQKKRNADIGESVLRKITDNCQDLNPTWLLTGDGSMILPKEIIDLKTYTEKADSEADFQSKAFTWLVFSKYKEVKADSFSYDSFNDLVEKLNIVKLQIENLQLHMETEIYSNIANYIKGSPEIDENGGYVLPDSTIDSIDKYAIIHKKIQPIVHDLIIASLTPATIEIFENIRKK